MPGADKLLFPIEIALPVVILFIILSFLSLVSITSVSEKILEMADELRKRGEKPLSKEEEKRFAERVSTLMLLRLNALIGVGFLVSIVLMMVGSLMPGWNTKVEVFLINLAESLLLCLVLVVFVAAAYTLVSRDRALSGFERLRAWRHRYFE